MDNPPSPPVGMEAPIAPTIPVPPLAAPSEPPPPEPKDPKTLDPSQVDESEIVLSPIINADGTHKKDPMDQPMYYVTSICDHPPSAYLAKKLKQILIHLGGTKASITRSETLSRLAVAVIRKRKILSFEITKEQEKKLKTSTAMRLINVIITEAIRRAVVDSNLNATRSTIDSRQKVKIDPNIWKLVLEEYHDSDKDLLYGVLLHQDDPVIASYMKDGVDLTKFSPLEWEEGYKTVSTIAKHHDRCMKDFKKSGTHDNGFENFVDGSKATYYYHVVTQDYPDIVSTFSTVLDDRYTFSSDNTAPRSAGMKRSSPSKKSAGHEISETIKLYLKSAEEDRRDRQEAVKAKAVLDERREMRREKQELIRREESIMQHSIAVDEMVMDVTKQLTSEHLSPILAQSYRDQLERLVKKQKNLDDSLDDVRNKITNFK